MEPKLQLQPVRMPPAPPRPPAPPTTGSGGSRGGGPPWGRRPVRVDDPGLWAAIKRVLVEMRTIAWPQSDATAQHAVLAVAVLVLAAAVLVLLDVGASRAIFWLGS